MLKKFISSNADYISIPEIYIYLLENRQSVIISEPLHLFLSPFVVLYTANDVWWSWFFPSNVSVFRSVLSMQKRWVNFLMVETHHFFPYIFVLCCLKYLVWCWWLCLINTNVKIEEKFNKFLAFGCMIQVQPYTNAYRSFNSLVSVTVRICWFICFNRLHYQLSNDGHLSFNFARISSFAVSIFCSYKNPFKKCR